MNPLEAFVSRHQVTREAEEWKWGDRFEFQEKCLALFQSGDEDRIQRLAWLEELANQTDRVLKKRHESAVHTNSAHWFQRGATGASSAVATLSGGTLIGHLGGTGATTVGVIAGSVGVLGAAIASAKPGASYLVDLAHKAQYEQLWWDMRGYGLTALPHVDAKGHQAEMAGFAQREAAIMATAPANATG